MHVNEHQSENGDSAAGAVCLCPGYETQADGLAMLCEALDAYLDKADSSRVVYDKACSTATDNRDRILRDADKELAGMLEAIQLKAKEAHQEINDRYDSKLKAAQADRDKLTKQVCDAHSRRLAKARSTREESIWLADAVLESSLQNTKSAYKAAKAQLAKLSSKVNALEIGLVEKLGPSNAARVVAIDSAEPKPFESVNLSGLEALIQEISETLDQLNDGGFFKFFRGRRKILDQGAKVRDLILHTRSYAEHLVANVTAEYEKEIAKVRSKHEEETGKAEQVLQEVTRESEERVGAEAQEVSETFESRCQSLGFRRDHDLTELEAWKTKKCQTVQSKHAESTETAAATFSERTKKATKVFEVEQSDARSEIVNAVSIAMRKIETTAEQAEEANPKWADMASVDHPTAVPKVVVIGNARLDLAARLDRIEPELREQLGVPSVLDVPAVLTLPGPQSFLIRHDEPSREQALATMRTVMLRILASFPAGKVRFTMADPVGIGQSFAGFMTLSDQEPSPVGQRIWSDPQKIEHQLADITEHMQTVIQKYLRADFETIEDYNHAAGEISEPYRFVVIADLLAALTETGAARLKSILESGPRCGVYALLTADAHSKLPPNISIGEIESNAVCLAIENGAPAIADERFKETVISVEEEPGDVLSGQVLERVARAGAQAGRVEVPFSRLAPKADDFWTRSCDDELVIPIGRSGAQRNQELRLGSGTRQHTLIAGRTGSGKSTLLHVIISAATLWHSPDELELYLIDFKKGVEFKAYTGGRVPHVRAVAIESDREFGLSVLKRLDDELVKRGELFRQIGAQDIASARKLAPQEKLPRVLLLIDEFQEFFTEDDEVSSEATLLLDRLVRQGRAFGVHVVLGSQTLAGAYSLARSTLGQIGVRIALQCSEGDSYLILGEDNNAARLLERPGEAIYNNAGGLVEGNSPFQTAWLPDAERDEFLAQMSQDSESRPAPIVFEGNRPAQLDQSAEAFVHAFPVRTIPQALLGDAVAIAPPTSASLQKRSGANLLIVGPQPEPALGMLVSAAISAGLMPNARVIVIDPTPEDDAISGRISDAINAAGLDARIGTHRDADRVVAEVNAIVQDRGETSGDPILLVLAGIHRLRSLRKNDDYSFSLEDTGQTPDKDLLNILREGPAVGVWTLAWCDTLTNVERAMERSTIREFGLRALMQMSASDSAALVDSSIASTLGANRAILADDVAGTVQKFRPIDLPDAGIAQRAAEFFKS